MNGERRAFGLAAVYAVVGGITPNELECTETAKRLRFCSAENVFLLYFFFLPFFLTCCLWASFKVAATSAVGN